MTAHRQLFPDVFRLRERQSLKSTIIGLTPSDIRQVARHFETLARPTSRTMLKV
jgi:hypothetical protein